MVNTIELNTHLIKTNTTTTTTKRKKKKAGRVERENSAWAVPDEDR